MNSIRALLLPDWGEPVRVEEITLDDPGPGEVLVRIHASGVCHTDLHVATGHLPLPVPAVLGHEGAGEVLAVGRGVTRVRPGDRVVLSWVPACGTCRQCRDGHPELCEVANRGAVDGELPGGGTRGRWRGQEVHPMSHTGTLAEAAVVPEQGVVPIPDDMPWEEAALLGCAVLTGVGAALQAPIRPGDTVAVIGCGGVGLNVIQGARLRGAARILAVDPVPAKRELALALGATETVDPAEEEPLAAILDRTEDQGVDVAFEVVGDPELIALAFRAARRGGTAVVVGVPEPHAEVTVNAFAFPSQEKTLTGSWYGGSYAPRDVPRLISLWRAGKLLLSPLISRRYPMDQAPQALEDLAAGRVARAVVLPQE